jgi:uncharacterized protein YggE
MPFTVTTSWRAPAIGAAAAALLIGAFVLGTGPGGTASASATAKAPGTAGTRITVTGTGSVSGTPDTLLLSMGVQASAASVGLALGQADSAVTAVTAALRGGGVPAADIQTSGLSIQPNYQANTAQPDGYGVSESIEVTLSHLSSAGTQISAAVRAGGNAVVVDGVSLDLRDTSGLLAAARSAAVADARVKAAQYASALGRALGPLVSMTEAAAPPAVPAYGAAVPSARSAAVPVSPGSEQLSVTVTAVFALA